MWIATGQEPEPIVVNGEVARIGGSWNAEVLTWCEVNKKAQARAVVHQHLASLVVPITGSVERTVVLNGFAKIAVDIIAHCVRGFYSSTSRTVSFPDVNTVYPHPDLKMKFSVVDEEGAWGG